MSRRDAESCAIPNNAMAPMSGPVPPSAYSQWRSARGSRGKPIVERRTYRSENLQNNGMYFGDRFDPLTEAHSLLMDRVRRKRDSPEPTLQEMQTELAALQEGAEELKVSDHFTYEIASSHRKSTQVSNNRSLTMHRQHMPSSNTANIPLDQRLSQPVPDLLYGYPDKAMSQYYMHTPNLIANTQGLILPFFAIEFKAEGPSSNGNLWVAENQAMGASVACVRIAENLNRRLEECANLREVQKIDTSAFSIAMSGSEARLFITWRDSPEKYIMKHVQSYAMSRPDNYLEFRRVVRNILDWGKDERLRDIFKCFDSLLEENRLQASKVAKDRSRPGSSSGSDVSRRRR